MKRTVLTVVALSGALFLGACGTETAPAGGATSSAGTSAEAAPTGAKVGDTVPLKDIAAKSSKAVEEKGTAHLTTTTKAAGATEADVDFTGSSPKMSMTMTQEGETVEMVYVDKVMYMGGDSFTEMTGGKRWIKIDPKGEDMMSKAMGPLLSQMESSMGNPAEQLEAYGDARAKVTKVDGGVTTYEITLSKKQLAAALEKQTEALPGISEKALEQIPAEGLTYTMSIDENALPVTFSMDIAGEQLEMTYSKWGEPVDIKAPAASEVGTFEMPDLG